VGPPWLNPRPAPLSQYDAACLQISRTAAPDQDDHPGAKGASTNHIKHQQAPLSREHCPLIRRAA
jgi:hypothetical protein